MAAFIADLQPEIDYVLLADLHVIRQSLAIRHLTPAALVEAKLSLDQIAPVLDQPIDAVVRPAAFLIRRERDDDVAVRAKSFLLVADEIRDPQRGLGLVVRGAAAIEEAGAFVKLERIHAPVIPARLHHVGMGQQ